MYDLRGVQYDKKAVIHYLVLLLVATAFWKVSAGFGTVVIPFLVLFAVLRNRPIELLFWVIVMTFSAAGNRQIFTPGAVTGLIVRGTLIMLTGLLSVKLFQGGREARLITPFWGIMFYILWECFVSFQGYSPIVSYLKLFLFFCIYLSMLGVANTVNRSTRTNAKILRSAILAFIAFVIIGSVLLIPFPSLSLMTEKAALEAMLSGEAVSLFQGMTSHSQVMGPMAAILGTFLFADLVFSIGKWDKFYVLMLLLCPFLVYKTSSRTAMGTFIAGIGMVLFLVVLSKGLAQNWKGKVLMAINALFVCGAVAICAVPQLRERATGFVLKRVQGADSENLTMENVMTSRQSLIDESMFYFRKKPVQGNGFQVSADMAHERRHGLAEYLSAPIEKGVWIYAVLEEGGVIGMVLFCGWLIWLFVALISRHAYIGASVFFAFTVGNLGEFSFFSMSYIGGIYWTLTFAAVCLDVQRMKQTNMEVFFVPIEVVREEVGAEDWEWRQG